MDIYASGRREIEVLCETKGNAGKVPPIPKDCEFEWRPVAYLSPHGKGGLWKCYNSPVVPQGQILQYGSKLSFHGITCTSRQTGLTCINLDKRGWEISKERRKSF
jgi:hypothetical protein